MNIFNLLFTFQGRINRAKWWLAVLILVVSVVIAVFLMVIPVFGALLMLATTIASSVAGIAVGIKRLHDRNKTGWWMLVFYGVPFAMGIVEASLRLQGFDEMSGPSLLASVISLAVGIWAFVELGCLRGSVGPNQYGPDPLAQA